MKNNKNKTIIVVALILAIGIVGISYAFFNYYRLSDKQYEVITGDIYLGMTDEDKLMSLTNLFPETNEEGRARNDNFINFSITGRNTTENKDLYFEIRLEEGPEMEGKTRIKARDLKFDLVEINGEERTTLVDAMSYASIDGRKIWVDVVPYNQTTNIEKNYELRMWIDEDVIISDTESYADYTTEQFRNSFANVKVSVYGDFKEKTVPYNYMAKIHEGDDAFWPEEIENIKANIESVEFLSLEKSQIEKRTQSLTRVYDVTDTNKSAAKSVVAWLEEGTLVTNEDSTTTQYYKMYVASDGITFFPGDSSRMFDQFWEVNRINFKNINTMYATTMLSIFRECYKLTSIDLSSFDTRNVSIFNAMFSACTNLKSLDLSSFNTESATSFRMMFNHCDSLETLDLSNFDTSNVTTMHWMFYECRNLKEINIDSFDTSNVQVMRGMFSKCESLERIDLSHFNTSSLTDTNIMFSGCVNLKEIYLDSFDVSKLNLAQQMFKDCSNLVTIYANTNWKIEAVNASSTGEMFLNCTSLVGKVPYDDSKVTITMANPDTGYFTRRNG